MRQSAGTLAAILAVLAAGTAPAAAHAAPAPPYTPAQSEVLGMRAAQADALGRLADLVLGSRLADGRTVGQALGRASEADMSLRVALRAALVVGEPRAYSDGVTEVDLEVPLATVLRVLGDLLAVGVAVGDLSVPDVEARAVEGLIRVCGAGRPPEDVPPDVLKDALAAPREVLPELYPLGWEAVTPSGRIQAARDARIRAYQAMSARVRGLHVAATATLGQQIQGTPAAEARLDAFLRSLPVAGRPRFMPDRVAEIEVAASVARLIEALRAVRPHLPADQQWPLEELDQISVRLKTDQLTVVGRGMPAAEFLRPALAPPPDPRPPPDWAALVLEAAATADLPEQALDEAQARLLASRAAKLRARDGLRRQLDEVRLADGLTVRERAAKDDAFAQDCRLLLDSARIVASRPVDGKSREAARHGGSRQATRHGGRWEVRLQLPLGRMAEFAAE